MIDLLTAPGSAPFTVALLVVFALLIFELVSLFSGLGVNEVVDNLVTSNIDMPDIADGTPSLTEGLEGASAPDGGSLLGKLLAWLYVGRVPVLIVFVVFLGLFGMAGLALQSTAGSLFGSPLPSLLAMPAAFIAVLPGVRWSCAGLARILPRDESNAVSTGTFIGKTAVIVGSSATASMAAQARLRDRHGTTHYLMVQPDVDSEELKPGELVLIVRKLDNGRFAAIANPNSALNPLDPD